MQPKLPELFGLLPKTKVEVPGPGRSGRRKPRAQYIQGTPDGMRPGRVYVNTYDFATARLSNTRRRRITKACRAITCRSRSRRRCPGCRRSASRPATTPTSKAGRCTPSVSARKSASSRIPPAITATCDELLRAIRLVLDTGVHYKHWTREQMVDYFHAHLRSPASDAETDRYIAWPGQALAYKIGQLKILELRERAKTSSARSSTSGLPRRDPERRRAAARRDRVPHGCVDRRGQEQVTPRDRRHDLLHRHALRQVPRLVHVSESGRSTIRTSEELP